MGISTVWSFTMKTKFTRDFWMYIETLGTIRTVREIFALN